MGRLSLAQLPDGPIRTFFEALHRLHRHAGEPSIRSIAIATERTFSPSVIHSALTGTRRVPNWPTTEAIVQVLKGDVDFIRSLWMQARDTEDGISGVVQSTERDVEQERTGGVRSASERPAAHSPVPDQVSPYGHAEQLMVSLPLTQAFTVPTDQRMATSMTPTALGAPRTKILFVDDHDLIRKGLRWYFERDRNFEIVGEAGTAKDAMRMAAALRPDVVIMDLRLPDGSGLEATRALRKSSTTMGIVILTMYAGDDQLFSALESGASAFLPKTATGDEVVAVARFAASVPNAFTAADMDEAIKRRLAPSGPQLSPRESQVLRLLSEGMSMEGIADQLYIGESAARTHASKLYEKLGAANRAQALMTALRLGLLQAPDAPKV